MILTFENNDKKCLESRVYSDEKGLEMLIMQPCNSHDQTIVLGLHTDVHIGLIFEIMTNGLK